LDDGSLPSLLMLGILIALHGAVELAYSALINCRLTALKEKTEDGDQRAKHTLILVENLSQLYLTCQIILLALRFAIVSHALITIAQPLIQARIDDPVRNVLANPTVGYLAVLLPVGVITFVLGGLVPSTIGRAYADQLLSIVVPVMRLLVLLLKPLVAVLNALQNSVSKATGGERILKAVTEEEIMTLVEVGQRGGTIERDEKEMIYSVLQFNEIIVREIMIPRPDISAVEINESLDEALKIIVDSGHSRIPVYEDDIDHVKGMLYAKDLLGLVRNGGFGQRTIRDVMRAAYFVPESKRADDLFRELQKSKVHIAVLVDEYGSTSGLVTIEDLVEEIVGDIKDEYDLNEDPEVTPLGENTYLLDGAMNIDDVNELLDVELSNEENDTIGGYITSVIGAVPHAGQIVEVDHVILRVERVENRRVRKVHATRIYPPPPDDQADEREPRDARMTTSERERARTERESRAEHDQENTTSDISPGLASFKIL